MSEKKSQRGGWKTKEYRQELMPSSVGFRYSLGIFNFIHPLLQTFSNPIPPTTTVILTFPGSETRAPDTPSTTIKILRFPPTHATWPGLLLFFFLPSLFYNEMIIRKMGKFFARFVFHDCSATVLSRRRRCQLGKKAGTFSNDFFWSPCDILSEIVGSDLAPVVCT